jgi:hypothetical protein
MPHKKAMKQSKYTAEIWSEGHMMKVDLLAPYEEIITQIISLFGEDFEIGELEGFEGVDTDENYSLLELNQMAHFLAIHHDKPAAKLLLNERSIWQAWDFLNYKYVGLFPSKEELAKEILKGRFNATERLIDCVDLIKYIDSLTEEDGIILIPDEVRPIVHAFTYWR